jgi:glycerol-3-phosphate cytidylyltransferase-like family protein
MHRIDQEQLDILIITSKTMGIAEERTRIMFAIDEQIRDTEDNPLYEGKERHLVLSTLRRVRRLVASEKE